MIDLHQHVVAGEAQMVQKHEDEEISSQSVEYLEPRHDPVRLTVGAPRTERQIQTRPHAAPAMSGQSKCQTSLKRGHRHPVPVPIRSEMPKYHLRTVRTGAGCGGCGRVSSWSRSKIGRAHV